MIHPFVLVLEHTGGQGEDVKRGAEEKDAPLPGQQGALL